MMKYLTYSIVLLTGFISGFLIEWWNSPISRPLCLDKGGDLLPYILRATPDGYLSVWIVLFAVALVPTWALLAWIGAGLRRIA